MSIADDLRICWHLLCRDGSAAAISSDLAGLWMDEGLKAVILGSYQDALDAAQRLYGAGDAVAVPSGDNAADATGDAVVKAVEAPAPTPTEVSATPSTTPEKALQTIPATLFESQERAA